MTAINISSFIANSEQAESFVKYGWKKGTVEATLRGKTQRVDAILWKAGEITAMGFVMKYRTGSKLWKASIALKTSATDGRVWEIIEGGFDSRSGKHQLINDVWFASDVTNTNNISKR